MALVPFALGFHPADSLVVLALGPPGAGGRQPLLLLGRADLPSTTRAQDVAAAVAPLLDLAHRHREPGTHLRVLLHDPDAAERAGSLDPGPRAAAALAHLRASLTGGELHEVLLVTGERWRSLSCDRPCCPPAGRPRTDAGAARVAAEAVWRGMTAAPDRDATLPPTRPVGTTRREAAARAARTARTGARPRREVVDAFATAVGERLESPHPGPPPAAWCGRVLEGLQDVGVRDAVLLTCGHGPATGAAQDAALAGRPGAGELLEQALAREFDPLRAAVAAALAVDVARHAAGPRAAAAWAAAAWLEWQGGRSARAGACVEQALRLDPRHRLAGLVAQAVHRAVAPHR
ncbi:DUF4192 family protein [Kineococcus aurantiacus]|uniref:DUF4192 domain-containing protein n=1 Tax=Kineococcus aurantiacus TaxID=37633 RepID=A0A7Y9DPJ9_9ACTN|nr:hypothetical protein [Kineococcus aurantiacus]